MNAPAWEGDWPISQWFGVNPAAYARFGLQGHNGLDIAMPEGTVLYAPTAGKLVEVSIDTFGYGLYVKLQTPDGQDWLFAHLSDASFEAENADVVAGAPIGISGSTGNSTGPHLHIGWRLWNAHYNRGWPYNGYLDPRQVLDRLQGGLWPPA